MPAFDYELVYPDGRRHSGRIWAADSKEALGKLSVQECKILKLEPLADGHKRHNPSVSLGNRLLFVANLNLRLSGQLQAGISLRKALGNITAAAKGSQRQGLQEVNAALDAGNTFSQALTSRRDLFPEFMIAMVAVGESTGSMADILQDVSEYYFDLYDMQIHLKQISLYPLFLCTFVVGLLIAFIVFIVPSFASLYAMLNIELHGVLRGLLFVREHLGLITGLGLGSLLLCLRRILHNYRLNNNYLMDWAVRIPVLCQFGQRLQEVRFCRVMSMQLRAGVDILAALAVAKKCVSGTAVQNMLDRVLLDLTRGITLYEAGKIHNCFLSAASLEFIAVGEEGNGYAQMLTLAHIQARASLKTLTDNLKTYLQPLIFLVTALLLGTVIIVLLQPMLGVLENIGNNW